MSSYCAPDTVVRVFMRFSHLILTQLCRDDYIPYFQRRKQADRETHPCNWKLAKLDMESRMGFRIYSVFLCLISQIQMMSFCVVSILKNQMFAFLVRTCVNKSQKKKITEGQARYSNQTLGLSASFRNVANLC